MSRLSSQTQLVVLLGTGAAIAAIAFGRRDSIDTNADAVYPRSAPPPPPPPPPTPKASSTSTSTSIPSHMVDLPASVRAATPLEVQQAVVELSRGPNFTPALPPPPVPSGIPEDFTARAVKDLTAPATTSAQRSPRQAAADLFNFASTAIREGRVSDLGEKTAPSNYVAAAQRDMRLISSDGLYGPKTAARGKELLGREFPSRTTPANRRVSKVPASVINALPPAAAQVLALPPPEPPSLEESVSKVSPREAAAALFELITHPPVQWGTKAKPNTLIRSAQADMGGLVADGVYGPKTQAKGKLLLGREFPARK